MGEVILTEDKGDGVLLATLNRPASMNTINHAWIADFDALLNRLDGTDDIRVLVITGAGRAFCAGADFKGDFVAGGDTKQAYRAQLALARIIERLCGLRQPVIAAVNGAAAGGGFALSLAAEIRIAARSASFHVATTRMGLSAGECGIGWLLPRAIGLSRSFELMLTGRGFDAEEADRIGYVSRVVSDEALLDTALGLAREIAANSPFGVWMTKDIVRKGQEISSLSAAIGMEARTQLLCGATGDFREAMQAFLEKRPPNFNKAPDSESPA